MDMGPWNSDLTLALILFLPLVPAYILFKTLPGEAFVNGPLKGFDINLSGAFAGYFALVLLLFSTMPLWKPKEKPQQDWTVTGTIQYDGGNAEDLSSQTRILLIPPEYSEKRDGSFVVNFKLPLGIQKSDLPNLAIDVPGYQLVQIPLSGDPLPYQKDQYPLSIRQEHIQVTPVINLHREQAPPQAAAAPAYNANQSEAAKKVQGVAQ